MSGCGQLLEPTEDYVPFEPLELELASSDLTVESVDPGYQFTPQPLNEASWEPQEVAVRVLCDEGLGDDRDQDIDLEAVLTGIYPNPTFDRVIVALDPAVDAGAIRLRLHDLLGRAILVESTTSDDGRITVELSDLPAGVYLLSVERGDERRTERIVKQ